MFRSILIPLDGSTLAEWAVPAASGIARRNGAQIELITVDTPVPPFLATDLVLGEASDPWSSVDGDTPLAYLSGIERRIKAVGSVPVKKTIRTNRGRVPDTILQYARDAGSDLIVMTTHGYGALKRLWLGSVADAVIRESRLPTLVIRPTDQHKPDFALEPAFRRILLPLDGSPAAEIVVNYALGVAETNAQFTLLRALAPVPIDVIVPEYAATMPILADADGLRVHQAPAMTGLDDVARRLRERKLNVDTVVVTGPYAAAILDYSHDHETDLIAVTTHGYGGATRLLLGSTADKIVRGANLPVLVYRPA